MRRAAIAAATLLMMSCGGSPIAPSAAVPAPRPLSLNPGRYILAITLSTTGLPTCSPGGPCVAISLCSGSPTTATASFEVQLERSGDDGSVTFGDGARPLAMVLHTTATSVSGSISGSARDSRGDQVDVTGTVSGAPPANPAVAVAGTIDGQVTLGDGSCSNNGHQWSLAPR